MKRKETAETVNAFIRAVYPEMTELCMTMNGEEDILKEATRLLAERTTLLSLLREARDRWLDESVRESDCPCEDCRRRKDLLARIDAKLEEVGG